MGRRRSRPGAAAQAQTQDKAALPTFVPQREDGAWTRPAKNTASTRFSGLDQINAGNVKDLQAAFTFSMGVIRGQEAALIYADGTPYVVSPYPNVVYAPRKS